MHDSKIIAVDDEDLVLQSLVATLREWAEARRVVIVPCRSGPDALAALEKDAGSVSVVVSDLRMPLMKGTELLRVVSERFPEVITILVTGNADIRDIPEAVETGIFSFVLKPWKREYLERELDKALQVRELRRERSRYLAQVQEELRWGGELQRALLRLDLPSSRRATYTVSSLPLPAFQCGGDYHDVVALEDGRTVFMVGDVAGHGVKAAFMTFFLRAAIRQGYLATVADPSPAGLLSWLNRLVCRELAALPSLLITLSVCMLTDSTQTLRYASAGHLPIYVVRGQRAIVLRAVGMGLGFDPDCVFEEQGFDVASGDLVVLHTDGLREFGPDVGLGDELFTSILVRTAGLPDFHAAVLQEVGAAAGGKPLEDDATLLTARVG